MRVVRIFRFFRYLNWLTIKKTFSCAFKQRLTGLSAEIAYNTMLGLFPGILAILTAIGMFEGSVQSSLGDLAIRLQEIVPEQVWTLLSTFVEEIKLERGSSWLSLSFVAAIWVFSGALSATMNALDQIYQVPTSQKRVFWKAKIVSLVLTIGTILLLIIASFLVLLGDFMIELAINLNWHSLLSTVWQILSGPVILAIVATALALIYQFSRLPADPQRPLKKARSISLVIFIAIILLSVIDYFLAFINDLEIQQTMASLLSTIWQLLSWPVALAIVATAFACIYRFGPSIWIRGTPILPGAILAAIFWAIVSALFRLYVSNFGNYNKVYGAVGAVIVLMLWLYISSLVMLLGYQLNVTVGEAMQKNQQRLENF